MKVDTKLANLVFASITLVLWVTLTAVGSYIQYEYDKQCGGDGYFGLVGLCLLAYMICRNVLGLVLVIFGKVRQGPLATYHERTARVREFINTPPSSPSTMTKHRSDLWAPTILSILDGIPFITFIFFVAEGVRTDTICYRWRVFFWVTLAIFLVYNLMAVTPSLIKRYLPEAFLKPGNKYHTCNPPKDEETAEDTC